MVKFSVAGAYVAVKEEEMKLKTEIGIAQSLKCYAKECKLYSAGEIDLLKIFKQ